MFAGLVGIDWWFDDRLCRRQSILSVIGHLVSSSANCLFLLLGCFYVGMSVFILLIRKTSKICMFAYNNLCIIMHIVDVFFQLMACFSTVYFSFICFTVSFDVQTSYYQYCQLITLLIYISCGFWLCWVLLLSGFSLVLVNLATLWWQREAFSSQWLLSLQSTGSGRAGFRSCSPWDLEHRIGSCGARAFCSVTCGIFPDQGSNPCLLHWQADSSPLSHQGRS